MTAWNPQELLKASAKELTESSVDCGTCPVSFACVVGKGGTGWKFNCCNATAYRAGNSYMIIDCGINGFAQTEHAAGVGKCPLCSGEYVDSIIRGMEHNTSYMRTVHSRVPAKIRLSLWKARLPHADEAFKRDRDRLKSQP
jgi:hypothetical protein